MNKQQGNISIVKPTGERMKAINTLAETISSNAEAVALLVDGKVEPVDQ